MWETRHGGGTRANLTCLGLVLTVRGQLAVSTGHEATDCPTNSEVIMTKCCNQCISNYIFENASRMLRMLRIEVNQSEKDVEVHCLCPEAMKRFRKL